MSTKTTLPTRQTGNDIPDDIWRGVADHIYLSQPRHELYRLISVNRIFFNYVLDTKYREVWWTKLDNGLLRLLTRLQEPIIGRHVQRLYIRAWFVDFLRKRDLQFGKPSVGKTRIFLRNLFRSLALVVGSRSALKASRVRKQRMLEGKPIEGFSSGITDRVSSKDIVTSMVKAVDCMISVTEFNFEWRDLPLNKDTQIFLTSTRRAFASSLRKLVLRAQISKFKEVLAIADFDNIDELDFHFDYRTNDLEGQLDMTAGKQFQAKEDAAGAASDPELQGLLQTVIPFIARRRKAMRSLSISSSSYADLSEFFSALPAMPSLRRFTAGIYVDKDCLSDPSGLLQLLNAHAATLLHIALRPNWPDRADSYNREESLAHQRRGWSTLNEQLLSNPRLLRNLDSLELPYVSSCKSIPLLQRSCDTLTRLSVTGHFLTMDEIVEVLTVFAHRLFYMQHLYLEVALLDVALVRMLANRLPDLLSLVLVYHRESASSVPVSLTLLLHIHVIGKINSIMKL
ncbi:hypothetical protein B0H34DRAFT_728965 [Crassisporium funariophilum]|nr:hypothetical protein B0H34DRAFT_728965 [Crassisporium funariophilum]